MSSPLWHSRGWDYMQCHAVLLRMCHISYCFNSGNVSVTKPLCSSMHPLIVRDLKVQLESTWSLIGVWKLRTEKAIMKLWSTSRRAVIEAELKLKIGFLLSWSEKDVWKQQSSWGSEGALSAAMQETSPEKWGCEDPSALGIPDIGFSFASCLAFLENIWVLP